MILLAVESGRTASSSAVQSDLLSLLSLQIHDVEKSDDFQKELEGGDLSKSSANRGVLLVAATLFLALSGLALYSTSALGRMNPLLSATSGGGEFDDQQRFILRNFDKAKPMSSFLNGLGGLWGVPMWAFYVNRGQGISSFGKQNKDSAIAKFVTAEKAYQQTPFTGETHRQTDST